MTDTSQTQRTFAVIRGGKNELMNLLNDAEISITFEKQIALTVADAKELTARNADLRACLGSKPAQGLVLEAQDVAARWLDIINEHDAAKRKYLYGSPSQAVAEQDITWIRKLANKQKNTVAATGSKLPTATARKATSAMTANKTAEERRTPSQQTRVTQRHTTASRGKPQPKLTQKTAREINKASIPRSRREDNNTATAMKAQKPKNTSATRRTVLKTSNKSNDNDDTLATTSTTASDTVDNTVTSPTLGGKSSSASTSALSEEQETLATMGNINEDDASSDLLQPGITDITKPTSNESLLFGESQPSESTHAPSEQDADDAESDHDAEVAAATNHTTSTIPATEHSALRASLSPNSVSSLPRPETPEVDSLRLRFESLGHTRPANASNQHRKSLSPEAALKIKETRPKTPGGTKVKSMVDFFMDENLHKWEF
ncbi:hypothetical protein BDB00DRAFT_833092 [Zychaea mexicana]|uniref:uncharacterized protein n=1 Tax=Zychaea mexicana TaxID=64656 RepID=UPI0022FDC825|nr:uncharacterized protein BDB00DRAFT_833092 [Zychaea mexicana]KAI9491456.1 hypothetical protein BDB00DRAFT_833092 [Zychaea mexicana]